MKSIIDLQKSLFEMKKIIKHGEIKKSDAKVIALTALKTVPDCILHISATVKLVDNLFFQIAALEPDFRDAYAKFRVLTKDIRDDESALQFKQILEGL